MSVERDEGSQREEDEIDEVGTEAGNNQTKGYKVRGESRYSVWRLTGATGSNDCDDDDDDDEEEEEEEDEEEEEEEKEEEKYDYYWHDNREITANLRDNHGGLDRNIFHRDYVAKEGKELGKVENRRNTNHGDEEKIDYAFEKDGCMREHNSLPVRSDSHGLRFITRYGYQEESGDSKKAEDIARDNDVSAYINSHIFRDHSGYGKKGEEMVEFQRNLKDRCDSQESGSDNSCNNYTDNDNNDDGDHDDNDDVECSLSS